MKLSTHFSKDEFEVSEYAARHRIDNTIPAALMPNLRKLVFVMQGIRDFLGVPVRINSGYRAAKLNEGVGGSLNSSHIYAAAADFIAPQYGSPVEIGMALQARLDQLRIKQLIVEFDSWVHVGVIPVADVNRVLTIDHAGTRTGIHRSRNVYAI